MTLRALIDTTQACDIAADFGAAEGCNRALQRLEEDVIAMSAQNQPNNEFMATRVFDAPRERVWQAWSQAEQLQHWWGPKGCKLRVVKLEFKPGGLFHYAMEYSTGAKMFGRFFYREIAAPEKISWINSFANAGGGIARAPFSEHCPLEMANVMTLTEAGGKTTLILRSTAYGANADEQKFFNDLFGSMEQGFGGTFDQLADYLAKS